MRRDPKGPLRARGEASATAAGVGAPYEVPTAPEVVLDTERSSVDDTVEQLLEALSVRGVLPGS